MPHFLPMIIIISHTNLDENGQYPGTRTHCTHHYDAVCDGKAHRQLHHHQYLLHRWQFGEILRAVPLRACILIGNSLRDSAGNLALSFHRRDSELHAQPLLCQCHVITAAPTYAQDVSYFRQTHTYLIGTAKNGPRMIYKFLDASDALHHSVRFLFATSK